LDTTKRGVRGCKEAQRHGEDRVTFWKKKNDVLRKQKTWKLSRVAFATTLQLFESQNCSHHNHFYRLLLLLLMFCNMCAKLSKNYMEAWNFIFFIENITSVS